MDSALVAKEMSEHDSRSVCQNLTVESAAAVLRQGGLVALPTETVYGLGGNAYDPGAVAKIFAAKDRPYFDPLIVHVPDIDWLPRVVQQFPPVATRLAERFWPGPLTLVLPKVDQIPDLVTSGLGTVGVRIPDHDLMRQVLRAAEIPVAAPSANLFGRLSPTTAEHVRMQLGHRIDGVLDGGPCRIGIESTILHIESDRVTLLRPGGISREEIEALIGPVHRPPLTAAESPAAPGMLDSHYAPRTPLFMVNQVPLIAPWARTGLMVLRDSELPHMRMAAADTPLIASSVPHQSPTVSYVSMEVLSPTGDLIAAAAHFFQALHRLDGAKLDGIVALRFPDEGLGIALNDRLQRASHSKVTVF